MLRKFIIMGVVGAVGLVGFTAYAFTASNTVPNSTAGDGTGTVSGYTASNVAYSLNATTPTNIDAITFTIAPTTATTVKIRPTVAGSWYSCTNSSGSVSCATTSPQLTASAITQLELLATS